MLKGYWKNDVAMLWHNENDDNVLWLKIFKCNI